MGPTGRLGRNPTPVKRISKMDDKQSTVGGLEDCCQGIIGDLAFEILLSALLPEIFLGTSVYRGHPENRSGIQATRLSESQSRERNRRSFERSNARCVFRFHSKIAKGGTSFLRTSLGRA